MYKIGDKLIYIENNRLLNKSYVGKIAEVVGFNNGGSPLVRLLNPTGKQNGDTYQVTLEYVRLLSPLEKIL